MHKIKHNVARRQLFRILNTIMETDTLIGNIYLDEDLNLNFDKIGDCLWVANIIKAYGYKAKTLLEL